MVVLNQVAVQEIRLINNGGIIIPVWSIEKFYCVRKL